MKTHPSFREGVDGLLEEMDHINQRKRIMWYIWKYKTITIREAFTHLNINSPSKRISELRQNGIIKTETCYKMGVNSKGEPIKRKKFARYSFADEGMYNTLSKVFAYGE